MIAKGLNRPLDRRHFTPTSVIAIPRCSRRSGCVPSRYQKRGFRTQTLLTSLLDPGAYPAAELVELYHERWELELGFDEVKTHTLERAEALLRCKAPERIKQELWGLGIAYNLVRLAIARVAHQVGVSPTRISYRHAVNFIRLFRLTAQFISPRCAPPSTRRPPQRARTVHPSAATPAPLPMDGENQNEQISTKTSQPW